MSLEVSYDGARRWVLVRATGVLEIDDVLRLIGSARASVEHRMWPMLFDARSATTHASERDIEAAVSAVVQAVHTHGPRGHVAMVSDDDVLFTQLLLYEARCAERGVRVIRAFRAQPDAERWLAIVSAARYFQNTP